MWYFAWMLGLPLAMLLAMVHLLAFDARDEQQGQNSPNR
ncbi:MAG: cytochrome bd-I oxidase subunit CydX [Pseudomonadales bacterium]|nr:cytochrome bd-I oxidase subunit CydX [Pseudomonadales bacterium]